MRHLLGLGILALAAACSNILLTNGELADLKIQAGRPLPDVRFVDENGLPQSLLAVVAKQPALIGFAADTDPNFNVYSGRLRDNAMLKGVRVIQVVYLKGGMPAGFSRNKDPRLCPLGDLISVCDPKGILRRELGIGESNLFVAVDRGGIVRQIGRLEDGAATSDAVDKIIAVESKK